MASRSAATTTPNSGTGPSGTRTSRSCSGPGVNLVTLGVFAWASLEPEPGQFTFDWLDEIMDLLHDNGIHIDLATPTAAPPVWLSHHFPEVLPVMADGETFGFGNRLHFDPVLPHLPGTRRAITTEIARRYADHPAAVMWHISNEFGPTAYNAQSSVAFRQWLRRRTATLEHLNDAWYTRFWGQIYTDWEQIGVPEHPPRLGEPHPQPRLQTIRLRRALECFVAERDIVRSEWFGWAAMTFRS